MTSRFLIISFFTGLLAVLAFVATFLPRSSSDSSGSIGAKSAINHPIQTTSANDNSYTVMRLVREERLQTVKYTQMTVVRENRTKVDPTTGDEITYTVAHHVPKKREKTIQYTVANMVPEQRQKRVE